MNGAVATEHTALYPDISRRRFGLFLCHLHSLVDFLELYDLTERAEILHNMSLYPNKPFAQSP